MATESTERHGKNDTRNSAQFVTPAKAGVQLLISLDDSLRSPCGPPSGRSTRYALLSGMRRIYNRASGWRKPQEFDSEWRPEKQEQQSRIQFGYDSVYEEMRARDNDYSLDTGSGLDDRPQNTQFKIGF